jgi:hypothetical protein
MVPARDRVALDRGEQRLALAQEAAQAGVDEGLLRTRVLAAFGGFDRLVDQREGLVEGALLLRGQREGGAQQRVGRRRWRLLRELPAQGVGAGELPQHVVGERLRARADGGATRAIAGVADSPRRTDAKTEAAACSCRQRGNGWMHQVSVSDQMLRAQLMA